jgi:hypothetical protein
MMNASYSDNNDKEARSSSWPDVNCKILSVDEDDKAADLNDRPKHFLSHCLPICCDLVDNGKLGNRFTLADELKEIDIGPGISHDQHFSAKS